MTRILPLIFSSFLLAISWLPTGVASAAQQPQTSTAPVFAANAKYVQGVGPGYWPTAGSGLTLNLTAGTAFCGYPPVAVTYVGGTLGMTDATTNYVYLDPAATCVPAKNTTGFSVGHIPLATVVAAGGTISTITDRRGWFAPLPCAMDSVGAVTCAALGTNQNVEVKPSGTGSVVIPGASGDNWLLMRSGPAAASYGSAVQWLLNSARHAFGALNPTSRNISLAGLHENSNVQNIVGTYGVVNSSNPSSTRGAASGVEGGAYHTGAGATTGLFGVVGYTEQSAGTVGTSAALYAYPALKTAGTVTTNIGLRVGDQNVSGATNYAILTEGTAPSEFGGDLVGSKLRSNGSLAIEAGGTNQSITAMPSGIGTFIVPGASGDAKLAMRVGLAVASFSATMQTYLNSAMAYAAGLNMTGGRTTAFQAINEDNSTVAGQGAFYGAVEARHTSGVKGSAVAFGGDAYHSGAGTTTDLVGASTFAKVSAGTVTRMQGLLVFTNSRTGGTVDNNYGIRIQNQVGVGTNNWAIKTEGTAPAEFGGAVISALKVVTFSSTPTFDASLGNTQKITLTGNVTSSTFSNAIVGQPINFLICQDATGGRTFVWPTNVKGGMTVGSTLSTCSAQTFIFDGTNAYALSAGVTNM